MTAKRRGWMSSDERGSDERHGFAFDWRCAAPRGARGAARPYTDRDLTLAVDLSAFLGWLSVSAPLVWLFGPLALFFGVVLGLPTAFAACWLVGAPIVWRLMQRPITWLAAVGWGATIAGLIAALGIALVGFANWQRQQNAYPQERISGGNSARSVDGDLTLYGWWGVAQGVALFILAGIIIALIVRAIVGPGRRSREWD